MKPLYAQIIEGYTLVNKDYTLLSMANRPVGLSYRASCRRDVDRMKNLRKLKLVYLQDTKRRLGRYIWRTTDKGEEALERRTRELAKIQKGS